MLEQYIRVNLPETYNDVEVTLPETDDFLKIKETLTRMGIASRRSNTLFQSCNILFKQGRYFIVHFKELFALDGRTVDLSESDLGRRNTIAKLLEEWGLLKIIDKSKLSVFEPLSQIKIIPHGEKSNWNLESKYTIGDKNYSKNT